MAKTTFAIPSFTITTTPTVFGPRGIPEGTQTLQLVLDLVNLQAGDRMWFKIEWDDGSNTWPFISLSDGVGPGTVFNKLTGQFTSLIPFTIILGLPLPAGWQIRATVWTEVANVLVPDGSINLS